MEAGTLHCPNCGAAVGADARACPYCSAQLASVACPSCFGMAFVGNKFCPHCGAELTWPAQGPRVMMRCPRCRVEMKEITLAKVKLHECATCCGLWVKGDAFEKICAQRDEQAAVLGVALAVPQENFEGG